MALQMVMHGVEVKTKTKINIKSNSLALRKLLSNNSNKDSKIAILESFLFFLNIKWEQYLVAQ